MCKICGGCEASVSWKTVRKHTTNESCRFVESNFEIKIAEKSKIYDFVNNKGMENADA